MKTKNPDWLYEGQIVYITARVVHPHCKPGTGLRCVVQTACGDAGILVNESYNFRRLVSRWDMYIPIYDKSEGSAD